MIPEPTETATLDRARLRAGELFAHLDEAAAEALLARARVLTLPPGSTLFEPGESYRRALFVLYDGQMELEREDGERLPQRPGAVLGLSNYLDNEPYATTARAVETATVLELPALDLQALEAEHPSLFDALNRIIADRIRTSSAAARGASGALARPVRSAMKAPLATCTADTSLQDAYRTMQERKIGSLGVLDARGAMVGMLTCSGVSRALALDGAAPGDPVAERACEQPHTIAPEAPLWQADEALQRFGVKYLVVVEQDAPVGVLSQTDILRALVTYHATLVEQTSAARTLDDLAHLYRGLHRVAREARETNRLASRAVRILSDGHLAIQRRCVELTLEELRAAGRPEPGRPFAVLVMGSGGRREMLLTPDQDNGLIIADEPGVPDAAESRWFREFAERLNRNLDRVGYILCPGEIMARNPMFHKTLRQWRNQISHLVRHPNQKAARWSNIVFDFDTLYGDEALTHGLRRHVLAELGRRRALLEFMVEDDAEGRPPLGLFNRLVATGEGASEGKIDIKRNGTRIVCDAARVYALSAGIAACNTTERLQNLLRQGVLSADLVDSVTAAYEELLDLLLGHQIEQAAAGRTPDKLIDPDALSRRRYDALRDAMRAVRRLQDQLQGQFGREAF